MAIPKGLLVAAMRSTIARPDAGPDILTDDDKAKAFAPKVKMDPGKFLGLVKQFRALLIDKALDRAEVQQKLFELLMDLEIDDSPAGVELLVLKNCAQAIGHLPNKDEAEAFEAQFKGKKDTVVAILHRAGDTMLKRVPEVIASLPGVLTELLNEEFDGAQA